MSIRAHAIAVMLASWLIIGICLAEMRGLFSARAAPPTTPTVSAPRGDVGCGSRGGPGVRLANGRCAAWDDVR